MPTLRSAIAALRLTAPPAALAAMLASTSLLPWEAAAQSPPPPPSAPMVQGAAPSPISDQAATLKAAVQRSLDELTKSVAPDIKLTWRNDTTVIQEGSGFRVDLPYLTAVLQDGTSFDVGVARMRANPADQGRWRISATMPDRIRATMRSGEEVGVLTVGSQKLDGLWLPELESLIGFDTAIQDVVFKGKDPGGEAGEIKISKLSGVRVLNQDGSRRWTGSDLYRLEGVSLTVNGETLGELGGFEVESKVGKADLAAITALLKTVSDVSATTASKAAGTAADGKPAGAMQQNVAQAIEMFGKMGGMVDSFSTDLRLKELSVTQPGTDDSYAVSEFGFTFGVEGISGEKSSVRLAYRHNGIEVGESAGIDPQYLPNAVVLDLTVRGLPNQGLWQAFTSFVSDMQTYGEAAAGGVLGQKMAGLMTTSESEIAVQQVYVNTDLASANLAGTAKFVPGSAFGVVAGFGLQFNGLKQVIGLLTGPTFGNDQEMKKIAGVLQLVSSMGKKGAQEDELIYEIQVGPKGEMTLNGNDMSALIALASGKPAEQPKAPRQQRQR